MRENSPGHTPPLAGRRKNSLWASVAVATLLGLSGCEKNTTTYMPPQWVPENANTGLDGTSWSDNTCQQSATILWEFMNEPCKLGYLGADVVGTIQSIKRLYEILDIVDNKKQTLHDVQEALNILEGLIANNMKEDILNAQRKEVYGYGKKLAYIKSIFQKHRERYFQGEKE